MDPWQPVQRSFFIHWEGDYNHWEGGQGHVDISVRPMSIATNPQLVGRAQVTFYHQVRSFLVGAPPYVPNEEILTPPVHESWLEDLQTFWSFEQTVAAQHMFTHIRIVPYMPIFVQDYFINIITSEARGAAVTAAALQHRSVSMVIDLDISINWSYDDDYYDEDDDDYYDDDDDGDDDDGDDDDDGGSYAAEMDEAAGEAEANPVVGGAEVDPAAAEGVIGDAEGHPAAAEGVIADAEGHPVAAEGVIGDAEAVMGGADVDLPAAEGEVGEAEVDPPAAEGEVGEAELIAGIGDIVLVEDPPGDPDEFVPLDTLLTQLIGQPLAPFLEGVGFQRGLTPAAIAHHLTVDTFMEGSQQECPICLEGMVTGTPVGWLPCSHVFHPECITNWLERSATCPICRLQLSNNIGD